VPLRVGYVVCRFDMGGLERVAAHLANGLDRTACQPFIFCLQRSGAAAQWLSRDDIPIVELHKRRGNDPGVVLRFARALREHRIDVIQSHNWGTLLETTLARRWAGTPVHVHAEHGQELDALHASGFRRRLRNRASRWAFDRCDSVVVCAESVRQRLYERCGYPMDSMHCILNGVDRPLQSPGGADALRRQLGLGPNSMVVGSLSRLVPVKDFGAAIAMLARLPAVARDVHLVLVGDGPLEAALRAQAKQLGVTDRVHLVGRQDNIGDWLALFDIYLNSSLSEALSMGLLEALSLGLPAVVTAVGDHPAVVGGTNPCGLRVPPGSADALAAAVSQLVDNPELRRELGRCALERYAELYTTQRMVLDYASHYRQLASRKSAISSRAART
jgi:glycosyltransferase involved in cell wall biosynthesis